MTTGNTKFWQPEIIRFMKTNFCALIFLLAAAVAPAQTTNLTALLQQGLFEEQANRNLDAAIAAYQSLATQFDKDRQLAATAAFRLGECYRAQGKTNEAAAQFQRLVRDFSDQTTLATLSRQNLTGMGMTKTETAAVESSDAQLWKRLKDLTPAELEKILPTLVPDAALNDLLQKRNDAQSRRASLVVDYATNNLNVVRVDVLLAELNRQIGEKISGIMQGLKLHAELYPTAQVAGNASSQQKELLAKQITLAEQDLADTQKLAQVGKAVPADVRAAEREVLRLRQQLAALDANKAELLDLSPPASSEEDQEIARIEKLIQTSPDLINAYGRDAITLLGKAATQGQVKVVNYLLDQGAEIDAGFPPLYQAAGAGNRAMVELLLSRGADVNRGAEYGMTALCRAVQEGYISIIELLLAHKADLDVCDSRNGRTPLLMAVENGREKCLPLLLAAGAKVDVENKQGRTPLSLAVENGSLEIIKTLLAAKADANGGHKDAPLLTAIYENNFAAAEMLLQAGANPNVKSAIHWPMRFGNGYYPDGVAITPLFLAILNNQLPMVQLLLKFKADPDDAQTDRRAVIFSALNYPEILTALLDAGAKVDVRDETDAGNVSGLSTFQSRLRMITDSGNMGTGLRPTPLLVATGGETNAPAVEALLKHGANPNASNSRGNTALHLAAIHLADEKIFMLLLAYKANPNVRNNDGETPLDLVKKGLQVQVSSSRFLNQNQFGVNNGNISSEQKSQVVELIALLHQHGALDNLPDWDRIIIYRPSANASTPVFLKNTNDWNHFTLLDVLLRAYPNPGQGIYDEALLNFPDLTHIVIVRPSTNDTELKRISVNLLNATNGVDCSRDLPLEFGDVVEIPEREHTLAEGRSYLTEAQFMPMLNYLRSKAGEVQLAVAGSQTISLPLEAMNPWIGSVLSGNAARAALSSKSDLSHIKVVRHDAATGKTNEWMLDYSKLFNGANVPDLRLRNGDVIEVPEKP